VGDPGFASIMIGGNVVCGLTGDGALYCWGTGYYGQVGNGSTDSTEMPTAIRPDLRFTSVSSGRLHTCGTTVDGLAYCWGNNSYGQLGNDSNDLGWTVPVPVWRQ
jgi:alpha-tubulin suppressor-like RCC1 family protein